MVLKLNRTAILILWGKYSVFVVPIDKTIKGNSYSNLQLVLQDFQIFYVTLFKTGFDTLQAHFNQGVGSICFKIIKNFLLNILHVSDFKSVCKSKSYDENGDFVPFSDLGFWTVWHQKFGKILQKIGFLEGYKSVLNIFIQI